MIDAPLPKIHRRKPTSHHAKGGPRPDRQARSEGDLSTEDEYRGVADDSQESKNACILLVSMWKDKVHDDDNVVEIFQRLTVEVEDFDKFGAIIASNLIFSTSLQTGYTMITTSTRRRDSTRIIGCSVSIASRSRKPSFVVPASLTQQDFSNFTTASLAINNQRANKLHSASRRRGLTKKNSNCKCVFRLHMDKVFGQGVWTLKPRKFGSHHSRHGTNAHLLKQHVQTDAVAFG